MNKYNNLKKLALASPQLAFDNETESGKYYNAAAPITILELIEELEKYQSTKNDFDIAKEFHNFNGDEA